MSGQMDLSEYSYRPNAAVSSGYPSQTYTIQTILAAGQSHRPLPMQAGVGMSTQSQSFDDRYSTLFQSQSSNSGAGAPYSTSGSTSAGKTANYVEVIARKPSSQGSAATGGNSSLAHAQMSPPTSSPEPKLRRRRGRVRFTDEQVQSLERRFREEQYLPASERNQLASSMELSESQVKTWFQNRRAKTKRALKRLRKARAAQAALNSGRQVPNVNIAATTWMNSPSTAMAGAAAPYSFQPMQFGVDAMSSPPVSLATPLEAYLYCSPTATESSSTMAYQTQPAMPSTNPHPQFVVGGLAVTGESSHRHLGSGYHAPNNPVLPQYNDYMHVPLAARAQRAISTSDASSSSTVPVMRGGYTMPYLQVGEQTPYQHRHA